MRLVYQRLRQFGPKLGLTEYRPDLDPNPLVGPYQYVIKINWVSSLERPSQQKSSAFVHY